MGYSTPKKPFDLKEFLSEKAPPKRRGWRPRGASFVRTPAAQAQPDKKPEPATES